MSRLVLLLVMLAYALGSSAAEVAGVRVEEKTRIEPNGPELVLNGASINFVAFAHYNTAFEIEGMIFALFVIVLAAGEAAIALAIVLNFYNNHTTVDVDNAEELKG